MAAFGLSYKDAINQKLTTAGSKATAHRWSPSLLGTKRFNIFNGNHVSTTGLWKENSVLYDVIESDLVEFKYLWEQNSRTKNMQVLPVRAEDAFVLGVTNHDTTPAQGKPIGHPDYDEFVKKRDGEILSRGKRVRAAKFEQLTDGGMPAADAEKIADKLGLRWDYGDTPLN
jgi:hypothetical protein